MSLEDDIVRLAAVPFLEGFGRDELRLIAFGTEPRRLDDGERLMRENAYGDGAYLLVSGRLVLSSRHALDVRHVEPGEMLAPMALLTDIEHAHTAVAEGPSEVLKISRQLFKRVLEEHPRLAVMLQERLRAGFAAMSGELGELEERLGE